MQTIFFGMKYPQKVSFANSSLNSIHQPTNQGVLALLKPDVMEIRFGKTLSVADRAKAFSKLHGEKFHRLELDIIREHGNIIASSPDASFKRLGALEQRYFYSRINPQAYKTLTDLLKPENLVQIRDARIQAHLKLLKDEGYIQPNTPHTRRMIRMEAEMAKLAAQLFALSRENSWDQRADYPTNEAFQEAQDASEAAYRRDYMALLHIRNEFAKAHEIPGVENFYDFKMVKKGLSTEKVDRFFQETKAQQEKTRRGLNLAIGGGTDRLDELLVRRNITTVELIREAARVIGQTRTADKILEKSIFNNAGAWLVPIDPPDDLWASIPDSPSEPVQTGRAAPNILHEILGHGLIYSFLDPTLPPQFRVAPFSPIADEGLAELLARQIDTETFWTDVLGFSAQEVQKVKKHLAGRKLIALSAISADTDEKRTYRDLEPPAHNNRIFGQSFGYYPIVSQNYDLGLAWGAQVEAAMKKKHGSLLTKAAWEEIRNVFSFGRLLDWQEQIKLLTSSTEEINDVVRLLKGTPEQFQEGKERIKHRLSGEYFSTKALFNEMKELAEIIQAPPQAGIA